jgi:hypothetical protein
MGQQIAMIAFAGPQLARNWVEYGPLGFQSCHLPNSLGHIWPRDGPELVQARRNIENQSNFLGQFWPSQYVRTCLLRHGLDAELGSQHSK